MVARNIYQDRQGTLVTTWQYCHILRAFIIETRIVHIL